MITLDRDGRFQAAITVDDKSYVLHEYNGKVTVKGATLSGRNLEEYNRQFIREVITSILSGDFQGVREHYDKWANLIQTKLISPHLFKSRETMNMSLDEYQTKVNSGTGSRASCYEIALKSERKLTKGDVVEYYIQEPPMVEKEYKTKPNKWVRAKLAAYEKARPISEYNNDLDVDHYIDRLQTTTKKFVGVLGWDMFVEMFPEIKLRKEDKGKMVPVLGFEKFMEKFPDFVWRQKDYDKLNEEDQLKFQQHFRDDKKLRKYFE